ncbi:MFS transporter [Paenibacillus aestuarii]|uniref:MFS transporter n=1 Tax=Paenibacillus aestuarii TaxID=516965 RepID=A0ABW0K3I7_9BACL|nr:MFS transporter [Paenibacillus aestuarii]
MCAKEESIWERNYVLLFISKAVKLFGDNFASMAMPWLMFKLGGDASNSLLLYAANLIPVVFLGFLVSPLIKGGNLKYWMFASDGVRALVVLVIPALSLYMGTIPLWVFYGAAFVQSACGSVYNPAATALLPSIVAKAHLQKGNALLESSGQIMRLAALTLSGAILTLASPAAALTVTAGIFLCSGVIVLGIRQPQLGGSPCNDVPQTPDHGGPAKSYWQQIREGFSLVCQHRVIFGITIFCIFLNAGIVPWDSLLSYLVYTQSDGNALTLTLVRAAGMIGAFVVGLLLARMSIVRQGALFIVSGILAGMALVFAGCYPSVWSLIICAFVFGMSVTAINIPELVIIQTSVTADKHALVFSVISALGLVCVPVATMFISLLTGLFSIGALIAAGGLLMVISGVIVAFATPLKTFKSPGYLIHPAAYAERGGA